MSCKLWGKGTSVSVNINFGGKMSILCKKNWNFWRNVDFFIKCALLLKVIIFLQIMLIFKTMCQNLIKKFNFLGYVNLFMCYLSVSFVGKLLFCFKIWFCSMILSARVSFPSKIYITLGINSLEKLSNFLRKVLI